MRVGLLAATAMVTAIVWSQTGSASADQCVATATASNGASKASFSFRYDPATGAVSSVSGTANRGLTAGSVITYYPSSVRVENGLTDLNFYAGQQTDGALILDMKNKRVQDLTFRYEYVTLGASQVSCVPETGRDRAFCEPFARNLYTALLERQPSPEELEFQTNACVNGLIDPETQRQTFVNSLEYRLSRCAEHVRGFYRTYLQREGSPAEIAWHANACGNGLSLFDIEQNFQNSEEFKLRIAGL